MMDSGKERGDGDSEDALTILIEMEKNPSKRG